MTGPTHCSRCGAPLADAAAGPVCPACLLKLGLTTPTAGETVMAPPPDTGATVLASPATGVGDAATILGAPTPGVVSGRAAAPPSQIGPYHLGKTLGEGGMGVVYLAEQTEPIRRTVALKLIKLGMDTHEVVGRFEAERQALAMMDHPNIASVLDAGATADGRPYFVMEYAPGAPITEYCDGHQLGTRARLDLFLLVCGAVQHAHQKGIIHRDLKPSNVLVVDQDGRPSPKVIDFGIAKATDQRLSEKAAFTQHGVMIGTPEYMSPEQADPTGVDIDTRTDIYSLGVVLYELLVGSVPFSMARLREAGYAELIRIIRDEEPARPSTRLTTEVTAVELATRRDTRVPSLTQELRGDLDWITLRALEKDRTRRYASVSEFAADVTRYLNNEPVVARPPSMSYRAQKFVRRNRLAVTAAALVALAVVGGLVVSTALYLREGRARRDADSQRVRAERAQTEAQSQRTVAEAERTNANTNAARAESQRVLADEQRTEADNQRERAERQAYAANIFAADISLRTGELREARRRLDACPPPLRAWEWHYLDRSLDSSDTIFANVRGTVFDVAFSPDGQRVQALVASGIGGGTVGLVSGAADGRNEHLSPSSPGSEVAVSPDGRLAVVSAWVLQRLVVDPQDPGVFWAARSGAAPRPPDDFLKLRDLSTGRDVATLSLPNAGRSNGPPAAVVRWAKGVTPILPLARPGDATGSDSIANFGRSMDNVGKGQGGVVSVSGLYPHIVDATFSQDGRFVAAWSWPNTIHVWESGQGRPIATLASHREAVTSVAFSRDGARLISGSFDRSVIVWDVVGHTAVATMTGHQGAVVSVALSPDGLRAASGSLDGFVRVWDAGSGQVVWEREASAPHALAFSPDGRLLVGGGAGGTIRIWDAVTGLGTGEFRGHAGEVNAVKFSADGTRILSAASSNIRLWTLASAALSVRGRHRFAISPDGVVWPPSGVLSSVAAEGVRIWRGPPANAELLALPGDKPLLGVEYSSTGAEAFDLAAVTASADGRLIANSTESGIRLWEANTGRLLRTLPINRATGLVLSRDGSRLFAMSADKSLTAWDTTSGRETSRVAINEHTMGLVLSSDERWLVSAGSTGIGVWDASTLALVRTISHRSDAPTPLALNADGTLLATLAENKLIVRDFKTGTVLRSLDIRGIALAFHPREPRLALALEDGSIRIFDAGTLEHVLTLRDQSLVHPSNASDLSLVPPGAAEDPAFRRIADQFGRGAAMPSPIASSLRFNADGSMLASGWSDATVRVHNGSPLSIAQRVRLALNAANEEGGLVDDLVAWLEANVSLSAEVRREAIRLARARTDDPGSLNTASWNVVKTPGASAADLSRALARAEKAVAVTPTPPGRINTLAMAQYRLGRYRDALATIAKAAALRAENSNDIVVSVLARLRLGQVGSARVDLAKLAGLKAPPPDLGALIKEATTLSDSLRRK